MGRKKQLGKERIFEKERLEQARQKRNNLFKKTIIGLASLTACLVTGYTTLQAYFSDAKDSIFYDKKIEQTAERDLRIEQARQNPESRQAYLESLISSKDIPYSSGVVYDADGKKMLEYYRSLISTFETNSTEVEIALEKVRQSLRDPNTPIKTPEIFDLSGQGIKPLIYANRLLFEDANPLCKTSEDITHVIRYHEGRHAEQFSKGLGALGYLEKETILNGLNNGKILYEIIYGLGEIDALNSELSAIEQGKSKVSKQLYEKTLKEYRKGRALFEKATLIKSPIQQELIRRVLKINPKR